MKLVDRKMALDTNYTDSWLGKIIDDLARREGYIRKFYWLNDPNLCAAYNEIITQTLKPAEQLIPL